MPYGFARRAALLIALVALAVPAAGQELGILSSEAGMPVTLDGAYALRGITPFSLEAAGAYTRVRVGGRGFEWRRAQLGWDSQGRPVIINDSRRRAWLGTLLPGGGSLLSGRPFHGVMEFASTAYLALGAIHAADDRDGALADYERWKRLAETANDPTAYEKEAALASSLWEEYRNHYDRQVLATGILLGLGVVESWWFNRPLDAQIRGQQIGLSVPRLSRGKAVFASLILPGMGQAYRNQWRSGLYLGAEAGLVQGFLESYRRRNLHQLRLDAAQASLDAGDADAPDADGLRHLEDRVQTAEDDMHLFAALAGGVWLINVMDTVFTQPAGERPRGRAPRLALLSSPSGTPGLGWSARF